MGGKSCFVRQVALLVILAQLGSWVPAKSMRWTPLDSIFTRMGATDTVLKGQSTFLVELLETAEALRRATPRSLVILDELGRGTSTHDGAAIAYGVTEFLAAKLRPILFLVTHFLQLARELTAKYPDQISAYHMAFLQASSVTGSLPSTTASSSSSSSADPVTFLYKLAPGPADRSFGLNVARLAGLPEEIITRASTLSSRLERGTEPLEVLDAILDDRSADTFSIPDCSQQLTKWARDDL